jgi:hypothetical protein
MDPPEGTVTMVTDGDVWGMWYSNGSAAEPGTGTLSTIEPAADLWRLEFGEPIELDLSIL